MRGIDRVGSCKENVRRNDKLIKLRAEEFVRRNAR